MKHFKLRKYVSCDVKTGKYVAAVKRTIEGKSPDGKYIFAYKMIFLKKDPKTDWDEDENDFRYLTVEECDRMWHEHGTFNYYNPDWHKRIHK